MNYTLYGSQTSPFVRRIRMVLENINFDFKELNIFETEDALTLHKVNPINQVPVLLDGDQKIWDSREIFNYINEKHNLWTLSWDEKNLLTAIESAMDAGIALLLLKRSGISVDEPYMFVNRQKERIESVLDHLKPYIEKEALTEWNFLTMTIYAFLDWSSFRGIVSLEKRPECRALLAQYAEKSIVVKTAIPKV